MEATVNEHLVLVVVKPSSYRLTIVFLGETLAAAASPRCQGHLLAGASVPPFSHQE